MAFRLRVASFNLESLDEGPEASIPLETRMAALRPQLTRLDADVLCLQEINARQIDRRRPRRAVALEQLFEGTPYAAFERCISLGPSGHRPADRHNLAIVSRWPLRRWQSLRHGLVPPPRHLPLTAQPPVSEPEELSWDRPLLHASVTLPNGRDLHLINLHLRAPLAAPVAGQRERPLVWRTSAGWAEGFYMATIKRVGQALEARLLVEQIFDADPQALIAVCGDLNAGEREAPLRLLAAEVEDTGNGKLLPRALVALARSLPESQRYTVLHGGTRALFDHLLASRELYGHFRRCEIHNEDLHDEGASAADSPESFHAPLVAEFAFN